MAGSITTILLLQITLSTISATPLYIETDEGLLIGTDTAPIQIPETAYINPFRRRSIVFSESENQVVYEEALQNNDSDDYIDEDDDDWESEDDASLQKIEEMHKNRSNSTISEYRDDGIRRCHEYINKSNSAYSVEGLLTDEEQTAGVYLCKFGYLEDGGDLVDAIKEFQRFVRVKPTGVLDDKTLALMKLPRCGDSDKRTPLEERRKKRWANSKRKWDDPELRYYIAKYTNDMPRKLQRSEIQRAVKLWSEVAPVDFKITKKYNPTVDIVLSFQYYYHRDDFSFDGTGGELAHAFLPEAGVIHFDDSEYWTSAKEYGINLYTVAAHEVGHSLGLEHTSKRGALMSPFYDNFAAEKRINPDDVVSIQNLYGWRGAHVQANCPSIIRWDTAFTDQTTGISFAFYRDQVWKFNEDGLQPGYPMLAIMHFQGLPTIEIEASLAFKNGYSFLFARDRYWKYNATSGRMARGYPKSLAGWGFPKATKINDVIRWPRNNYVYFFTYNKYYRYNSAIGKMDPGYPQPLYLWQGVPTNFDGAMTSMDGGYTFFFIYHYYFPFNNRKAKVETDQVQEIKYSFFLCEEEVADDENRARFLRNTTSDLDDKVNDANWNRFKELEIDLIDVSRGYSTLQEALSWNLLLTISLCLCLLR